jgi:hypothetical protein
LENKYQQQIVDEMENYKQLLRSKEELQAQFQQVSSTAIAQFSSDVIP